MKWVFAIFYHPMMVLFILLIFLQPFIFFSDLKQILTQEVPTSPFTFSLMGLEALWVYIAMKSQFFGKPYRKLTILLPLLQMFLYTCIALNAGLFFVNKWADQGSYSKGLAIVLAILAILVVRLLMSILYWKYPLVQSFNETEKAIRR
ncbi:hypothetical protein ACI7RC_15765 [Brevibacillus sp. B_LB10_24]|uniref:hypothetical protein n=1 Tax=Brevibacillus sp. B_LB10_24 TaxID=3380645 RepID=UPI0038BAF138